MRSLDQFLARAVIFDLDGTLTDNMHCHAEAFSVFVERHGLPPITMAMRHRIDGKRNAEIFPILFDRPLATVDLLRFEEEKEGLYRELSVGRLQPVAGAARLLDRLAEHGVPVALATSAPRPNVGHTLREIGFASRLTVVVRSDEVPRGKPFPDVYLAAARRLDAAPRRCLAFEDAPVGVAAARASGMRCVALTTTFEEGLFAELGAPPDAIYRDFDEYLESAGRWLSSPTLQV